jgi:hypothetical protein
VYRPDHPGTPVLSGVIDEEVYMIRKEDEIRIE